MGSVTWKAGRRVEVASLSAGDGYGRGVRALALAARRIGRAWRGLVKSVGQQSYYLAGPSPWLVRDLVRQEQRDADGGPRVDDTRGGPVEPAEVPSADVRDVRRLPRRAGPLVGAR